MAEILTLDDLRRTTGYTRAADVERCLREQGVRFFRGRTGPWTTVSLINAAAGLVAPAANQSPDDSYPADVIPMGSP